MRNYLTCRSQSVYIDGSLSPPLNVEVGVPQGSILGPLCYIIYTNEKLTETHLLVMSTWQKRARTNIDVTLITPTEAIRPIKTEKLLGIFIHENMKWSEYVQDNDQSLIKKLTTRLNALKLISGLATFKVRLMVGNGIFCSKLVYGIAL